MRAGTLRHFLEVYRQVNEQSDSGAVSQVRKHICTLRCHLLKQSGYYSQNNIEQADKMTLVFETWINDNLRDTDTVEWSDQEFRIFLIEKDILSRTMKIHIQKIIK
jgi:hypothetical protein